MPIYLFEKNGKIAEVVLGMNDPKEYFGQDGNEDGWKRVFLSPNVAIDSTWNEDSEADFVEKTSQKKGSIGDLLDKSKELSEIRKNKYGTDKVKEKKMDDWSKERRGLKHPAKLKEEANKILNNKGITLEP